jgi:hypothetical protein
MAIATVSLGPLTVVPTLTALEPIAAGSAVAVLSTGIQLCSATEDVQRFVGFAVKDCVIGEIVPIFSSRGEVIVPVIEGGGTLTPGRDVFLSSTRGCVSTTGPAPGVATFILRVGVAYSPTEFVLITDIRTNLR